MSKQASPTVIGGFVVGAVALIVAGVLIFGSGKFFADTVDTVMYFEGDLKGLQNGSAVAFEGVNIGTVTDIGVFINAKDLSTRTPVVVEIERGRLRLIGENKLPENGHVMKVMVEQKGLRAQLQSESMVTGQRFIQLAFYPDVPPTQFTIDLLTKLPEIPTIPTTLAQMQGTVREALVKISEMPLDQIGASLNATLQGIDRLVNAPEVMESMRTFKTTLVDIQQLVRDIDKKMGTAVTSFTTTMGKVDKLTGDLSKLTENVNGRMPEVLTSFTATAQAAQKTLDQAQQTLTSVNGMIEPNSPVRYEMVKALRDLSEAARALRGLADYLERYPNSVVFGRTDTGAK